MEVLIIAMFNGTNLLKFSILQMNSACFFEAEQKTCRSSPSMGKNIVAPTLIAMSDAEIIVILIRFHSGGFRCFKCYYLLHICKSNKYLFPNIVSYIIVLWNWRRA